MTVLPTFGGIVVETRKDSVSITLSKNHPGPFALMTYREIGVFGKMLVDLSRRETPTAGLDDDDLALLG